MKKWEMRAIVKGKVQGVGFRWTVVEHAEQVGLTGAVKNLSDGSVEIIAQGDEEQLNHLLKKIEQDPGLARIHAIEKKIYPAIHPYKKFAIE